MDKLVQVRDKVLDRAVLKQGERLLEVGAGEGWIGLGVFGRGAGEVVFSDISTNVLDACREAAEELGVADRCEYVEAAADDLSALEDASVDAVTTRSVLIYVAEKQQALREFFRVLRPGGRVSLSSPSTALPLEGVGAELLARRSIPRGRDRRPGGETQRRLRRPPAPF